MKFLFLHLIRLYQNYLSLVFSWFFGIGSFGCRFYPTCSDYAKKAIDRYGVWRGIIKGVKRLLKCNPLFLGGYDPVE